MPWLPMVTDLSAAIFYAGWSPNVLTAGFSVVDPHRMMHTCDLTEGFALPIVHASMCGRSISTQPAVKCTCGAWYLQANPGHIRELAELNGHSDLSQVMKCAVSEEQRVKARMARL